MKYFNIYSMHIFICICFVQLVFAFYVIYMMIVVWLYTCRYCNIQGIVPTLRLHIIIMSSRQSFTLFILKSLYCTPLSFPRVSSVYIYNVCIHILNIHSDLGTDAPAPILLTTLYIIVMCSLNIALDSLLKIIYIFLLLSLYIHCSPNILLADSRKKCFHCCRTKSGGIQCFRHSQWIHVPQLHL